MANSKITVVLCQTQSKNPRHKNLEEEIATALIMDPEVDFAIVPHLYDLSPEHTGMLFLNSVPGDLVVLGWLYPRAIRWTLDRNEIKGQAGLSLLDAEDEDEDDEPEEEQGDAGPKGIGAYDAPDRKIYCLDLRRHDDPQVYLDELRRIATESKVQTVELMSWIQGKPNSEQLQRYLKSPGNGNGGNGEDSGLPILQLPQADETLNRRWYPVIDYDRCTNCLECIDFCLFGVYGIDEQERILVELQDNCKRGCPACSRVCPENAIIFPQHKDPAISGTNTAGTASPKIDLSKLFGAPSGIELAAQERDHELLADGREAVGMTVGIPKRQQNLAAKPKDDLDSLMDDLDELDL